MGNEERTGKQSEKHPAYHISWGNSHAIGVGRDSWGKQEYVKQPLPQGKKERKRMVRMIDADALAKFIDYGHLNNPNEKLYSENDIREMIDMMPTVDAVPVRHGEFIGTEYDGYADGNPVYYEWKCSECGCIFEDDEPTYNYCPNCGARMRDE